VACYIRVGNRYKFKFRANSCSERQRDTTHFKLLCTQGHVFFCSNTALSNKKIKENDVSMSAGRQAGHLVERRYISHFPLWPCHNSSGCCRHFIRDQSQGSPCRIYAVNSLKPSGNFI
jgi:hypothetical protein